MSDIWNEKRDRFYSYEELCARYGSCIDWLQYTSLITAIPWLWKQWIVEGTIFHDTTPNLYDSLLNCKNVSKVIYSVLIENETKVLKYARYWMECGFDFTAEEYRSLFAAIKICVKETKLADFQYRLLLNKVHCNNILKKWGVVRNDSCTFCNTALETPLHLFVQCAHVESIWQKCMHG